MAVILSKDAQWLVIRKPDGSIVRLVVSPGRGRWRKQVYRIKAGVPKR
jgi:hypothetical protein